MSHLRAALGSGRWRPVALVDVVPEYLAAAREMTGLPEAACFTRIEDALAAVPSDAVAVASPVMLHAPQIMAALGAERHVLTEKCFTVGLAEAEACVAQAERHDRRLMVVQNARLFPPMRTLRGSSARRPTAPGALLPGLLQGPPARPTTSARTCTCGSRGCTSWTPCWGSSSARCAGCGG